MHFTIVSYTFPPSREIGGRRWAKFSQHLRREGHTVTVVCADQKAEPGWYEREFPGIDVVSLPPKYPEWMGGYTRNIKEKLSYFAVSRLYKPLTRKNIFDRGFNWKQTMLGALEAIHGRKPIDILVTTGGPFSIMKYGTAFRKKHPEVKYIVDLRDPWTTGVLYGIPSMSPAKKAYQEAQERRTIEGCDLFCYPTESMGDKLAQQYPAEAHKLYLLPHAYDPEKFPEVKTASKRNGFIYGGTIYFGLEDWLKKLDRIVKANPASEFQWDIYTGTPYPLIDADFAKGKVMMHPLIPEEKLFVKVQDAAAYLVFFPESERDLISTKFYEIVYSGTPILYIGADGLVADFITGNKLGVHVHPDRMEEELPQYLNGDIPFEPGYFDVSRYSFAKVTQAFLERISQFTHDG